MLRVLVAADTPAGWRCRIERHVADRGLSVGFNLRLAVSRPAPGGDDEPGPPFQDLLEFVVGRHAPRMLVAKRERTIEQVLLYGVEQRAQLRRQIGHRQTLLLARIAPRHQHRRLFDVLRSDLDAQRDAAQLPLRELPAGTLLTLVERDADAGRRQLPLNLLRLWQHGLAPVVAAN